MKPPSLLPALLAAAALTCSPNARAATTVAPVFSDHMVLQRDQPIVVWGTSDSAELVEVRLGEDVTTASVESGKWQATLPERPAGGPYELTITSDETLTLTDILVGDVWLAGGQSNMQWEVSRLADRGVSAKKSATNEQIRFIEIARNPDETGARPLKPQTPWQLATSRSVAGLSAVGWFFANSLQPEIDVPLGIIDCNRGGSIAETWMSPTALASDPAFAFAQENYQAALADHPAAYEKYLAAEAAWLADRTLAPPRMPMGPYNVNRPSGLYETMLSKVTQLPIKGVIFYQGESNADHSDSYEALFTALIADWRSAWNNDAMPFVFVQLAGYGKTDFRPIREAQDRVWKNVPHTAMVTAIDVGAEDSIHPLNKQPVGERLALAALATVYDHDVIGIGPSVIEVRPDADSFRVTFDQPGSGLSANGEVRGFEIAGENRVFNRASVEIIDESTVRVSAGDVSTPAALRYAWQPNPQANLTNSAGLPAFPYRSDDWSDAETAAPNLDRPPSIPAGTKLTSIPQTKKSRASIVTINGIEAVKSEPLDSPDTYRFLFYRAENAGLGDRPRCELSVQYLDEGNTAIKVNYLTIGTDWRDAGNFRIGDSGVWKTHRIAITDADFATADAAPDVRLRVLGGVDVVISGVWIQPLD